MAIGDKSDTTLAAYLGRPPDQVAYVVDDFDSAVKDFGRIFGVRRWSGWVYDRGYLPHRTYRGQAGSWISKVAIPEYGPSMEIIVASGGPSVFSEFLDRRGPGLHHVGYFVPSLPEATAHLAAQGLEAVQTGGGHGVDGDGSFAFWDLTGSVGCYLELIEPPVKRYPPHFSLDT